MDRTMHLLSRAHEGDKTARDQLVQENQGLVYSIVRRYAGRGYDFEDLVQTGMIGLIKAIDRFDLTMEVRFSTYAVPVINGEIRRFLRDDGMVRVSRSLKENLWRIQKDSEAFRKEYFREPSVAELAEITGIDAESIVLALSAGQPVDSLQKPVSTESEKEIILGDQIRDEHNEIDRRLDHMYLEQLLGILEQKERQLIYLRYFQFRTQSETARQLGMTQVQVSRTEKKLLQKMKNFACRE